jgi:Rieske Fe-S protein
MKRGEFLKLSCSGCLLGAAGLLSATSLLSSCTPKGGNALYKAAVTNKQMTVPLAQLALKPLTVVRGAGMEFDIAVHKTEEGKYEALLLRCTHFSNPLIVNGTTYTCALHGSEFDGKGKVKKGPASTPLAKLPCTIIGDNLIITIA